MVGYLIAPGEEYRLHNVSLSPFLLAIAMHSTAKRRREPYIPYMHPTLHVLCISAVKFWHGARVNASQDSKAYMHMCYNDINIQRVLCLQVYNICICQKGGFQTDAERGRGAHFVLKHW